MHCCVNNHSVLSIMATALRISWTVEETDKFVELLCEIKANKGKDTSYAKTREQMKDMVTLEEQTNK